MIVPFFAMATEPPNRSSSASPSRIWPFCPSIGGGAIVVVDVVVVDVDVVEVVVDVDVVDVVGDVVVVEVVGDVVVVDVVVVEVVVEVDVVEVVGDVVVVEVDVVEVVVEVDVVDVVLLPKPENTNSLLIATLPRAAVDCVSLRPSAPERVGKKSTVCQLM